MPEQKIIVCRTHFVDERLLAFARSIDGHEGYHVVLAIDESHGSIDTAGFEKISLTREAFEPLGLYTEIGDIFWRCGDYPLYLARLRFPGSERFWLIEYDVTINREEPIDFFRGIDDAHAHDFLATHFRKPEEWWPFRHSMEARSSDVYRCYFPLVRLSGRALDFARAERARATADIRRLAREQRPEWANDEAFVATVLQNNGFRCADFNELGRHYTDATFWMNVLFHPSALPAHDGLIYHTVRTGRQFLKIVRPRSHICPLPEPSELLRLVGVDWSLEEVEDPLVAIVVERLAGVGDNPERVMAPGGVVSRMLAQNSGAPVLRAVARALARHRMTDCLHVLRGWRTARWWPEVAMLDNVALARPAWQSSVSPWSAPPSARGDAEGGNNGDLDEEFGFHTDLEPQPWWTVDLMRPHLVSRVRIHNRHQHAERMNGFRLLASADGHDWRTVHRSPDDLDLGQSGDRPIEIELGVQARFLRVQTPRGDYLHFREFEAYGVACG